MSLLGKEELIKTCVPSIQKEPHPAVSPYYSHFVRACPCAARACGHRTDVLTAHHVRPLKPWRSSSAESAVNLPACSTLQHGPSLCSGTFCLCRAEEQPLGWGDQAPGLLGAGLLHGGRIPCGFSGLVVSLLGDWFPFYRRERV